MDKTLIYNLQRENSPKVSKVGREASLFFEGYIRAFRVAHEITDNTCHFHNELSKNRHAQQVELYNYPNNIVLFSAPRGGGKTSAMLTFSETLHARRIDASNGMPPSDDLQDFNDYLQQQNFIVLPPIDPSILDDNHDILSVILSNLYNWASDYWKNNRNDVEDALEKRQDLVQKMDSCYHGIKSLINGQRKDEDWTLEGLRALGQAATLRKLFYEVIISALKLSDNRIDVTHFVIQVDDADMNFTRIYRTLEYIKDYLIIPNVIVLLAADVRMVSYLVRRQFAGELSKNSTTEMKEIDNRFIDRLTQQYIMKFLPPGHQIHLMEISRHLQLHWNDLYLELGDSVSHVSKDTKHHFEKYLLRQIFLKTGLYFRVREDSHHYILPSSQRGIINLVALLNRMKDIPHLSRLYKDPSDLGEMLAMREDTYYYYPNLDEIDYDRQLQNWADNMDTFSQYFMNEWLQTNLTPQQQNYIRDLSTIRRQAKNAYVIRTICNRSADTNMSYVNMRTHLHELRHSKGETQLEFAVNTYYSIYSQQLVLSKLISQYDRLKKADSAGMVKFLELWDLYGSEFFSPIKSVHESDKCIQIFYHARSLTFPLKWEYEYALDDDKTSKHAWLRLFLTSLFTTHFKDRPRYTEKNKYQVSMNILSPFLNSLYMDGPNDIAPSVANITNKAIDDMSMSPVSQTLKSLQDASLRLIINHDCVLLVESLFRQGSNNSITENLGDNTDDAQKVNVLSHIYEFIKWGTNGEDRLPELLHATRELKVDEAETRNIIADDEGYDDPESLGELNGESVQVYNPMSAWLYRLPFLTLPQEDKTGDGSESSAEQVWSRLTKGFAVRFDHDGYKEAASPDHGKPNEAKGSQEAVATGATNPECTREEPKSE